MISPVQTTIRRGGAQDAAAVADLHAHSWSTAYRGIVPADALGDGLPVQRRELWELRLTVDYGDPAAEPELLIADQAGETVGFIYLVPQPDGRVLVDNLHVRPGRTGGGIGRALFAAARAHVAERHPGAELYLEVLRDNIRAIAFYEREGGVRTRVQEGVFPGGYVLPECVYSWPAESLAAQAVPAQATQAQPTS